jgi:hypothetical protein
MVPQEADEGIDIRIPPHPGREAGEGGRTHGLVWAMRHMTVDCSRIRPIRFDGHDGEAMMLD